MGEISGSKLEEMLTCPVCRDIFKDPHQLPCGHSMCMSCMEGMIDHSSFIPFRCPNCRRYFGEVVGIQKSYALSGIVEDFRANRSRRQETKSVHCDFCPEKETLAKKTCLKCEVSMCEEHVKVHQELQVFTGHPLVEPLSDLLERKCPQHEDQVLKYYCNTSRRYICNLCALESKQQSQATEASTVLRRQLTEYMDQHFKILGERIQESNESLKNLLRDINTKKVDPAQSPFNTVTVALLFLWFAVLYYAYSYSVDNQTLTETLSRQRKEMHDLYISIAESYVDNPMRSHKHPETEDQGTLLLDPGSASPFLELSGDLRTAERVKTKRNYADKPRRFNEAPQVLSARCFSTGTHIWEVEAEGYWDIAVSYKSIERKSKYSSAFGNNAESWSLMHNGEGKLFAYHNGEKTVLSAPLQSSRITVSVDIEKGNIMFSDMNSTLTHLHTFHAELSEPVCLGFGLYRPPSRASIVSVS